jgi:ribonucleotide reductase alpha subunit
VLVQTKWIWQSKTRQAKAAPERFQARSDCSRQGLERMHAARNHLASMPSIRRSATLNLRILFLKKFLRSPISLRVKAILTIRHLSMAKDLASVEEPGVRDYWTSRFLDILEDFKFVPGGRITSNAGTGLKGTTYINCFVSGFRGENQDSMESIMDELRRQALILKSEGGYGFCADVMRPRGAYVEGIGGESPGAVKLLEMWDSQSAVITAGSGFKKKTKKGKNKNQKGCPDGHSLSISSRYRRIHYGQTNGGSSHQVQYVCLDIR